MADGSDFTPWRFPQSRSKVGVSFSECFPFYEYFEPELQGEGTNQTQISLSLDFGEDDKCWQSINARQINREILPMLQGISQSSLANGWGEMIRSWICFGVVCFVRDFHPPPALLFRALMHPSVIIVIYAQSWNPWLLTPSPTHLGKKKRQQDRVLCMTVVDWGEADVGKSHVREDVMWKNYELYRWIDERDMFPVYKLKRLQKAEGLLWRHR